MSESIEVLTTGPTNVEIMGNVSAGDIASEATLAALKAHLDNRSSSSGDSHLVSGNKKRFRREFNDATLSDWDVSIGTGQTVLAGSATTGDLAITTGTTPNAETTVTSKESFSAPFKAAFGVRLSQKIANQEFYVEVVAETPDGTGIDETVVAAWRIAGSDSTTVTNARHEVRNGGDARIQSANIASQASQTAESIYEIILESDEVWFHSRVTDSSAGRSASQVRNSVAPSPNRKYRLRYRVRNGATAPASNTTFTSKFATCVDYAEFQMEVTGGQGSSSAAQSIPVVVTSGSIAATLTSTAIAASATVVGAAPAKVLSTAGTNSTIIKASAGRVYGYNLSNTTASWRYVKFYNLATAPVVGTTVPVYQFAIPPGGTVTDSNTVPISHATGIGMAITAGPADNDATAVGANDVVGMVMFL